MQTISVAAAIKMVHRIKGDIKEETARAVAAATYIEGKEPAFGFDVSIAERERLVERLVTVETAIAVSNATCQLPDGMPVLRAIREREELKAELAFYQGLSLRVKHEETDIEDTFDYDRKAGEHVKGTKETHWVSSMTQVEKARKIKTLQVKFDTLNDALNDLNHRTTITV
jgi:hypothetical protein